MANETYAALNGGALEGLATASQVSEASLEFSQGDAPLSANERLARIFDEMGKLKGAAGESASPFRARAYAAASRTLRQLDFFLDEQRCVDGYDGLV